MHPKAKEILKLLSLPLVLLGLYISMYILWAIIDFPSNDELVIIVREWFSRHGLWIVFIGAFIEGFLLLGQYFPGGFIIFLGVISAGNSIPKAALVVAFVCVSFFLSYTANYILGKFGWYKLALKLGLGPSLDNAKKKLSKNVMNAMMFSYWEPNLASITATAAGVLQVPWKKFLLCSLAGILIWNTFWGTVVYLVGESAVQLMGVKYGLVILAIWVTAILLKKYWYDRRFGQRPIPPPGQP